MAKDLSPADALLAGIDTLPGKSLLAAGGVALSLYLLYRQALPKPLPGIPFDEESAKRILGDVPYLQAMKDQGLAARMFWPEQFDKYGTAVSQYFMGPTQKAAVALGDYREVHDLLLRHGKDLCRGPLVASVWHGVMPAHFIGMEEDNPAFKAAKALGKDLMTPSFLHEVNAPASYQKVLSIVKLWQFKSELAEGRAFDAAVDLGYLTYDIITAAALNIDDNDTQIRKYIRELGELKQPATVPASTTEPAEFPPSELTDMLSALFTIAGASGKAFQVPSPKLFHLFNNRTAKMKKAYHDRDTIIRSYIGDAVRRLQEEGDNFKPTSAMDFIVMREAAAAKKENRAPDFYSDTVVQVTFGYLLGGQDSTHATLSFLVKRIGANQAVQTRLRDTLRKAFPEAWSQRAQPPLQELVKAQIPYLDAVIEEVLRIDPPAVGITRETKKEIKILGHTIPKDTVLFLSFMGPTYTSKGFLPEKTGEALRSESSRSHAGAYDVDDWTKSGYPADEYHPDRWLKESEDGSGELTFNPRAGPFLTFSTGTRVCWGKRLAYLELKLVVTVLVWNFVFERLPENLEDWVYDEDLFMKPKNCRVKLSSAWDV
ncbi:putative cytochrome P450 [Microdochium trichocladiopsis]|uniref:Cytochrome P450 n=1 Tax=Microdochium trichocladiopsis TaxID=1682393 RepID=A0A9P8YB51_9PEZI|nr:putative cytochrome P450 [Microdochium trichocladiopsis]KAH7037441.1 putative cytochrome P450 [Microdochium trichocladiopsis]